MTLDPSSPELDHLHRPRWLVPLVGFGLAILVVASCYVFPPAYRAYKHSRAERAAKIAATAIDNGDWEVAAHNVLLAISLAPESPAALREAARMTTLTGHPNAFQYWQMLFDHATPTRSDRLLYTRLMLRMHRTDLARVQLVELLKANLHDPEAMELSLAMLQAEGRTKDALVAARALADEYPDRPGTEVQLARVLLATGLPGDRESARHILWNVAFRPKPDAFSAITELSRIAEVPPHELRMLARRAPETHTNALYRLLVDHNLRFRLDPKADHAEAARSVVALVRTNLPMDDRLVALDWLLANAPATNALEVAAAPWYRTNTLVLQRRLQALAILDRWDEIATHVEDEDIPLEPIMRDLYRAIVATHRNRPEEAANHLASAASRAGDNPEPLQLVAAYAESLNQPRIAADALQPLLGNPTLAPTTGPRILGLLNRVDDVPPMIQALDRLLVFDPANDRLRNELAWLRLLTSDRVAESRDEAEKLVAKQPENSRYVASLALGWLRLNEPEKARETLEKHPGDATNSPVRTQLVECAVLGATGRRDAARRLATRIPLDGLRSEERLLVRDWLDKAPAR